MSKLHNIKKISLNEATARYMMRIYPVIRLMHAHVYTYSRKYHRYWVVIIYAYVQVINAYSSACLQLYLCVIYTSQTCPFSRGASLLAFTPVSKTG